MKAIKWFTQRVTGLIVIPTVFLVIPFVLAKTGQVVGLWVFVDRLYPMTVLFWLSLIVTRGAFSFAWYKLATEFGDRGESNDFFWFKPEQPSFRDKPNSVDKSGDILLWAVYAIFAFVAAEFAISLSIWTYPLYLPPLG